jgi:iron complex transport system ATP-binding protein
MAEPAMLEARNLTLVRGQRTLLTDVGVQVVAGDMTALVGPNGAGKSTLMKALAGVLDYQGEVYLQGTLAAGMPHRERARRLAYVPQHSALDVPMPVRDVVAQGRFAHRDSWGRPSEQDDAAVARALEQTDVVHLSSRPFTRLSYGERRLVLLARALSTGARVLLLDEPTAALDVAHALALLERLRDLARQGHAIVVALHHLDEVLEFCNKAVLLQDGRVVTAGPVADVITAGPVRDVFGVELVPRAHNGYKRSDRSGS